MVERYFQHRFRGKGGKSVINTDQELTETASVLFANLYIPAEDFFEVKPSLFIDQT